MKLSTGIGTLLVTTALLASAAPASADTVAFRDPRGDAAPRFDLTRVTLVNSDATVVVGSRVRDLRAGVQLFQGNLTTRDGDAYLARTVRRKNGTVTATLLTPDGTKVPCAVKGRWRLARDLVRLAMPRDCLPARGRLRVSALIGPGSGSTGDPADWTRTVRVPFN